MSDAGMNESSVVYLEDCTDVRIGTIVAPGFDRALSGVRSHRVEIESIDLVGEGKQSRPRWYRNAAGLLGINIASGVSAAAISNFLGW
jgi:hypothetical protein